MNQKVPIHQLLYSTFRIEGKISNGTSVGTGFIFEHRYKDAHFLFLVTNKHVVEQVSEGSFFFTKANKEGEPILGDRLDVKSDFSKVWHFHPGGEDIAVTPILPLIYEIQNKMKERVFFKPISLGLIPTKEEEEKLTALEDIIFIGYPNAIYDQKNLLPIIRKGTTATPIFVDYEGKPIFLIDASVFQGSSGSPVFIYNYGSYSDADGGLAAENRIYFVGVISQSLIKKESGKIEFKGIPSAKVPFLRTSQMLNLGVVIKPKIVIETIEYYLKKMEPKMKLRDPMELEKINDVGTKYITK